jgi:hypothetical protein
MLVRLRTWPGQLGAVRHEAQSFDADVFERPIGHAPALRPFRPPMLYHRRLPGYPSGADYWFTFADPARSARPTAAVLVRGAPDGTAKILTIARPPDLSLTTIVPALATALRRLGYSRLWIFTLTATPLAHQLRRAGFVPRHEYTPLIALALTELGARAMRSSSTWEITELDCDR